LSSTTTWVNSLRAPEPALDALPARNQLLYHTHARWLFVLAVATTLLLFMW
jgi:hypothetical protein